MIHTFIGTVFKQGNRCFIDIPFNVWEICGQKGNIAVEVTIQGCDFECRLIPKGDGFYYIPIKKSILKMLNCDTKFNVSFNVISYLTRINRNSPYTLQNPIRKITDIKRLTYPKAGYCGQQCIAMLTGLSVEEVSEIMQAKAWQCSFSKLLETLDYFGISYEERIIYTRGKTVELPKCCIVNIRDERRSHFALYYHGEYYGETQPDEQDIISYLKINTE